jgi:hypothetical protein
MEGQVDDDGENILTLDVHQLRWEEKYLLLKRFNEREGHCTVPRSHKEDGVNLGFWVSNQRQLKKTGKLDPYRRTILEAIGFEWRVLVERNANLPRKVIDSTEPGPPKTVTEYKARLVAQKKEMYKDPPILPLGSIQIESYTCPLPVCDKATGALTFTAKDSKVQKLLEDFHPNRSPEQVLRAGSLGGTYFRPIVSAVTNTKYNAQEVLKDTLPKEWIDGLATNMLTSATYRPQINKYGVKCGGSLGMWESSGWITDADPYGWFQWYCRFYQGRRCSDDSRQISRYLASVGPKGRFRSQLCNKILAAQTSFDNTSISPVIRQTLLHWGLEIIQDILDKHKKRVGK